MKRYLLILLLPLFLLPGSAQAAIGVDTTFGGSASATNVSSATVSGTLGADAKVLIVAVESQKAGTNFPNTVTWNGVSMTKAFNTAAVSAHTLSIWYLASPATGTHDVVATFGTNQGRIGVVATSFTGASTTDPVGITGNTSGTSATPSLSVTTVANNSIVFNAIMGNDDFDFTATGSNQTKNINQQVLVSDNNHNLAASTQTTTTAGSYTSSWSNTSQVYLTGSIEVKADTSGGAATSILGLVNSFWIW